ncbi:MAG: ROK family protein, partial [Bacilli bacterium]|nr:ROK family protein [Bacilli bacterium]
MYLIGCDIGGTSIKSAIVDENGKFIKRFSFPVDYSLTQEEIIEKLANSINEAIKDAGLTKDDISGIGIGCPGSINSITGICDFSNNLDWHNLPVTKIIEENTGIKARIANDANAACLGEIKFGAAKNLTHMILITLGTGVGGGVYLDGHLFEGNMAKGAELGHSVIVVDGRPCNCGRKGCLERYASATALIADTKAAMEKHRKSTMWEFAQGKIDNVNGLTAFECYKKGDEAATEVVNNYIKYLGEGLTNFANIFRPEAIVIGGGVSGQKEALTVPLEKYVNEHKYA